MPTVKQRRAIEIVSENVGISMSAAMRLAGYSESSARQPQRVLRSLRPGLSVPSDMASVLVQRLGELAEAESIHRLAFWGLSEAEIGAIVSLDGQARLLAIEGSGTRRTAILALPDNRMRAWALQQVFRLLGLYDHRPEAQREIDPYGGMTDEELAQRKAELVAKLGPEN